MTRQDYYPVAIPAQVLWLHQFANMLSQNIGRLAIEEPRLRDGIADALWLAYLVGPWRTEQRRFALAATWSIEHAQTGTGSDPMAPLAYREPPLPEGVVPRPPGALKRLFKLIRTIKVVNGYDESIGLQLGILPRKDTTEHAVPTFKLRVVSGMPNQRVIIRYSKHGHAGIFIQCQQDDGEWDKGSIATGSVFEDKRPLRVPGRPELRHYRFCFWDGQAQGDWTDVVTVTVGP